MSETDLRWAETPAEPPSSRTASTSLASWFRAHGDGGSAGRGNRPLRLGGDEVAWIEEGRLELFLDPPDAPRRHVATLGPGSLLVAFDGTPPAVAIAQPGVRVHTAGWAALSAAGLDDVASTASDLERPPPRSLAGELVRALEDWIDVWNRWLARASDAGAPTSEPLDDEGGPAIPSRPQRLDIEAIDEVLKSLRLEVSTAFESIARRDDARRRGSLSDSVAHRERRLTAAHRRLASVFGSRDEVGSRAATDDPLLAACRAVGASLGLEFQTGSSIGAAPRSDDDTRLHPHHRLDRLCRSSRIRWRQVALRGDWWRQDIGPLR